MTSKTTASIWIQKQLLLNDFKNNCFTMTSKTTAPSWLKKQLLQHASTKNFFNVNLPAPENKLLQLKSFQSTLETTSWSIKQQRHLQTHQKTVSATCQLKWYSNLGIQSNFGDPKHKFKQAEFEHFPVDQITFVIAPWWRSRNCFSRGVQMNPPGLIFCSGAGN